MTADEFTKISGWIMLKLKMHDDSSADSSQIGIKRSMLVTSWLEENESELSSEEVYALEKKKVRGVINRLVKVNITIIILLL
jgi:hypothetical protein